MRIRMRDLVAPMDPEHIYWRDTGEKVLVSWAPLPKSGWRMRVWIDGDGPHVYTTRNDPLEWARAYQAEDRGVTP